MVKLGLELIIDSSFKIDRNGLTVTHYIWSQQAELNRRPTDYEFVSYYLLDIFPNLPYPSHIRV